MMPCPTHNNKHFFQFPHMSVMAMGQEVDIALELSRMISCDVLLVIIQVHLY